MGKGNKIAAYTFILIIVFGLLASFVFILNSYFIMTASKLPAQDIPMLLLLLFPSTAAMAFPLGFFPAITCVYSLVEFGNGPLKEKMKYGMITAVVFTVLMTLFNNYCVPAANLKYKQEYRGITAAGYSKQAEDLKGLREMSFEELLVEYRKGNDGKQNKFWLATEMQKHFSLPFTGIAMAILGIPIGLIIGRKKRPGIGHHIVKLAIIMVIWVVATFIYYIALTACQNYCYKGEISAWFMWLPDVIIIIPGTVMICLINKGKTAVWHDSGREKHILKNF